MFFSPVKPVWVWLYKMFFFAGLLFKIVYIMSDWSVSRRCCDLGKTYPTRKTSVCFLGGKPRLCADQWRYFPSATCSVVHDWVRQPGWNNQELSNLEHTLKRSVSMFSQVTAVQCFPKHYNNRALRPHWKIPKMGVYNYCASVKCN